MKILVWRVVIVYVNIDGGGRINVIQLCVGLYCVYFILDYIWWHKYHN